MEQHDVLRHLRNRIGGPAVTQVNQRELESYVDAAFLLVAAETKARVKEITTIGLVTGERTYRIPNDCLWVIFVSWNDNKLTPSSTYKWDRDGTNYRSSTSVDVLSEFAVQGRNLIVNPPPTAAAIVTAPYLTLRYLSGATLADADAIEFSDIAAWTAIYQAALLYLYDHPSDQAAAMIDGHEKALARFMLQAKRQSLEAIQDYAPSFRPQTSRTGGAR